MSVVYRDEESGCLAYCFAADPSEPNHIQVYELWTDPESLAAHFDHPNYAAMVEIPQEGLVILPQTIACI